MGNDLRSGYAPQSRDLDPERQVHLRVGLSSQRLGSSRWSQVGVAIGFCALVGLLALVAYILAAWHLEIALQAHELERREGVNDNFSAAAIACEDEAAQMDAALDAAAVALRETEVVVEALVAAQTSRLRNELESMQRGIDKCSASPSAGQTGRQTLGESAAPQVQDPASPHGTSGASAASTTEASKLRDELRSARERIAMLTLERADLHQEIERLTTEARAQVDQAVRRQKQLELAQADARRLALVLLGEAEAINEAAARARYAARAEIELDIQELTKERFELRDHVKRLTARAQVRADEVDQRQQQLDAAKAEIQLLTLALSAAQTAQQAIMPTLEPARIEVKAEVQELTREGSEPRASAEAEAERMNQQSGPKLWRTQP